MKLFILGACIGGLVGFAIPDAIPEQEQLPIYRPAVHPMLEEMTPEERGRSTCYALAPRHETYSVVLPQGVQCITVLQASPKRGLHE